MNHQPADKWLEWQRDHAAVLAALQEALRAYHRSITASAFLGPVEEASAAEIQQRSLREVEAARVRLDEVRARKPE